jgi:hypothetical protein
MSGVVKARECVALGSSVCVIAAALALWSHQPTLAEDKPQADPVSYLQKIASTDAVPYHARQLVVYMGLPQSAAVLDIRSTPKATFVRADAGGDVVRLWRRPGTGLVSAPDGAVSDDGSDTQAVHAADVVAKYEVSAGAPEKMLGVDVVPLTLVRRSDQLTVERLWVNPPSGVVYRRELYSEAGRLVGLSTIIDMQWGQSATAERYEPGASPPARAMATAFGSAPRSLPYGYDLTGAYALNISGSPTKHWVYDDGLHALSVFSRKGGLRVPQGFSPLRVDGATVFAGPGPGTWTWEGSGRTWVVVAEEPDLDPARLLAQLPHDEPSVWARMGRFWSKLFALVRR